MNKYENNRKFNAFFEINAIYEILQVKPNSKIIQDPVVHKPKCADFIANQNPGSFDNSWIV